MMIMMMSCVDVRLFSCPALTKSESESEVMKKQTDGLAREYDRLLKEHQELQVTPTHKHSRIKSCWVVRCLYTVILMERWITQCFGLETLKTSQQFPLSTK